MKQSKLIAVKLIPSILPVSLPTVRSWIFQKKLPVVRLGRKVFVREEVLEKIEKEECVVEANAKVSSKVLRKYYIQCFQK